MQRVLSFQMARNAGESSEYVKKRLCFSFVLSIGFLCILCGFLLGRFATEKTMEARAKKMLLELEQNSALGLGNTDHLQQLALQELERISFDYMTDWEKPESMEDNLRYISEVFYNLSFVQQVTKHASCVRTTVRGSQESDRYVVLSVNGDAIPVALELAKVLDRIYSAHDWRPRRSLLFCVCLQPTDNCSRTLPDFIRRKVMAYVAIRGRSARARGAYSHVALSGSDVMRSLAVEAVKTIPGDWTYLEYEMFGPRLSLDIPQVIFSLNTVAYNQTYRNQSLRSRDVTLAQMVSQTVWRLSESIIIQWKPNYFNETINRILETIDNDKSQDAKEKLRRTLRVLLAAVKDVNVKIDATENNQMLRVRIWNDLLLDLDKALLCPDEKSTSKTDLTILRKLSLESIDDTSIYINEMTKCYKDAIEILEER